LDQQQQKVGSQSLHIDNNYIPEVEDIAYLGTQFFNDLQVDLSKMAQKRVDKAIAAVSAMKGALKNKSIPPSFKATMIKSCLIPMLTYGVELWGQNRC
jgi:hypothetical protein